MQQQIIQWRRTKVIKLLSKGKSNQSGIAIFSIQEQVKNEIYFPQLLTHFPQKYVAQFFIQSQI